MTARIEILKILKRVKKSKFKSDWSDSGLKLRPVIDLMGNESSDLKKMSENCGILSPKNFIDTNAYTPLKDEEMHGCTSLKNEQNALSKDWMWSNTVNMLLLLSVLPQGRFIVLSIQ